MSKLKLWRNDNTDVVVLDTTPTGEEEDQNLFNNPVSSPTDLNAQILNERRQDMSERLIFADRAFLVTLLWMGFLAALTLIQIIVSFWDSGLSDVQFGAVVTTTSASVFGYWYLVGKYLHRGAQPDNSPTTSSRDHT